MTLQQHIESWRTTRDKYRQQIRSMQRRISEQRKQLRTMPDALIEKERADAYEAEYRKAATELQKLRAGATRDISRAAEATGIGKAAHWLRTHGHDTVADAMLDNIGTLLQ
jgi:chromosome segregation ATPase